jgi:uncharacterized protein (TIGR03118 family)
MFTGSACAQTKAFRQTNLASSISGAADNTAANLSGPWAVAFLPGQSFYTADNGSGSITSQNSSGSQSGAVRVPAAAGMSAAAPTGIASDASEAFEVRGAAVQYVAVTQGGTISAFAAANGEAPAQATLARDDSATGAVYTSVALLHPSCCAPFAAVADFSDGSIHTFTSFFDPLNGAGSFQDPNLPAGYAPYGIQVIGNQVYVTYAVQNAAKNAPVMGAGNGVVNVFDLQGNFVRRLTMGGNLNTPWGITQASANFGPFSGAILVGNVGDGTVSAFDASSGNFLGQLRDGDGNLLVNPGIRALAFRADGGADPNTLFFTSENANGQGGLFGEITAGLLSVTRASAPTATAGMASAMTVTVAAGPGDSGTPTGMVTVSEGGTAKGAAPVVNGVASLMLPVMGMLMHSLDVQYSGDANFVPSSTTMPVPAAAAASFAVAASPTSVSVSPGQSAPVTITVTPSGGFTGNVSLSCASVPSITCSFVSSSLSITSGSASTTMNINTTPSTPGYGFLPPGGLGLGLGGLLAALALVAIARGQRERFGRLRVPVLTTAAVLGALALSLTLGGCGYGSSYTAPQNAGPAMMTVTAQSGSVTQSTTVSVTVQ